MAHVLTDEAFALADQPLPAARPGRRARLLVRRRSSSRSSRGTSRRWPGSSSAAQIPDPARFGIDVIFPAAMIGLAVGLITGRRELVAAIVGAGVAVVVALASSPAIGIVAGGVIGPRSGCSCRRRSPTRRRRSGRRRRPSATRCRAPSATRRRATDPDRREPPT